MIQLRDEMLSKFGWLFMTNLHRMKVPMRLEMVIEYGT